MKLADRVAIVTGGGRGIGKATALALAGEGASVVVCARSSAEIDQTADQIREAGGQALAVAVDVSREADVAGMADQTVQAFGRIDVLVNNAGTNLPYREVVDLTLDEWTHVMDVNLTGPFLCSRAVLPTMIEQGSGKIVNISSLGGRAGAAGRTPYRPTKAGLISFTECLAAEVKRHGIDVNCVCPGGTSTRMMDEIGRGIGVTDLMAPEEIASVVLFLVSGESSAITGASIDAFGSRNPLFS